MHKYPVRFIHLQLSEHVPIQAPAELVGRARQASPLRHHLQAKQTLIRPDVPPDVLLKQELPLAAVLPPGETLPPAIPEFAPPSTAPLLARLGLNLPSADVISMPNRPLRAQNLLVVPPANQVASNDGGAGSQPAASPLLGTHSANDPQQALNLIRISQPKDGKFGIVVSGSSASDQFPEGAGALSGKVIYTVYVRVGLRKNWILQYCLPQGGETGTIALDAPWPFLIIRPEQLSTADLDYIIVRGMINSKGRFEQLSLAYPSEFSEHEKLLGALRQWTFRPASRDGEPVAVEALLVIPGQGE